MKIALLGATGNIGSRLISELQRRGHEVTAIARDREKLQQLQGVTTAIVNVQDQDRLAAAISGHDALIHSVRFLNSDAAKVVAAVKKANVPRLIVVGGAGSLEVAPGLTLVNAPNFPAEYKAEALAGAAFLEALRREKEIEWTYLSPPAIIAPGERTGQFRLGKDHLLIAVDGRSHISIEDYSVALVDELEHSQHIRQRFTVGY